MTKHDKSDNPWEGVMNTMSEVYNAQKRTIVDNTDVPAELTAIQMELRKINYSRLNGADRKIVDDVLVRLGDLIHKTDIGGWS